MGGRQRTTLFMEKGKGAEEEGEKAKAGGKGRRK